MRDLSGVISGPPDDVMLPDGSTKSDWEVELAFVIGKRAQIGARVSTGAQ